MLGPESQTIWPAIPYQTVRETSNGDAITAIDEGIINSMALATWVGDKTIDVTIINGREGRAIKRQRNKVNGQLQPKIDSCKNGSRKHRRLVMARKKINGKTQLALSDFDHQVSRKAANHVINQNTGRLIAGDVRGIERHAKAKRRMGRHGRRSNKLSEWSRGRQERYLYEKTGLQLDFLNESGSTKTCPASPTRNRPSGRHYRCKDPDCGFTCHRDVIGSINILQQAIYGEYTRSIQTTLRRSYTPVHLTPSCDGRPHGRHAVHTM